MSKVLSDIEIAQSCALRPITEIAAKAPAWTKRTWSCTALTRPKVNDRLLRENRGPDGKLILVTAITPTPAGEGKTTTSIGLADGLRKIGKRSAVALREPSGPCVRRQGRCRRRRLCPGGAHGGHQPPLHRGLSRHRRGQQPAGGDAGQPHPAGQRLGDRRQADHLEAGRGYERTASSATSSAAWAAGCRACPEDGFQITVASEIMAVLCLADGISDLKARLARMIVAYTYDGRPVTAHDLWAEGGYDRPAEGCRQAQSGPDAGRHPPAFIHGGPFANIAHGCNSVTATRMALKLADYAVTEAGFAADLGG